MYTANELLFPDSAIAELSTCRTPLWAGLVARVAPLPEEHPERLALSLLMIRMNGCLGCETDSFRAMRGCVACSRQTLRRYKATDEKLLRHYARALTDVCAFLNVAVADPQPDLMPLDMATRDDPAFPQADFNSLPVR